MEVGFWGHGVLLRARRRAEFPIAYYLLHEQIDCKFFQARHPKVPRVSAQPL